MTLEAGSGQVLAGPDIVSRGFVYVRGSESLMDEAKQVLEDTMEYCMEKNITDWGKIKTSIKDDLGEFVWKKIKEKTNDYANYYGSVGMCMNRLDESISNLVAALKDSPEYRNYQEMWERMKQDPQNGAAGK